MSELNGYDKNIINAAKQVFIEKGFERAKMQEIADAAGISRTALNYYFRTKENLFYSIVDQIFEELIPRFDVVLVKQNQTFAERMSDIVDVYNDFLQQNTDMPYFILSEINRNPKLLVSFIQNSQRINTYLGMLKNMLETAQQPDNANDLLQKPVEELITIMYGLVFTPYIITPLVKEFYNGDEKRIDEYYKHHVNNIKGLLVKIFE